MGARTTALTALIATRRQGAWSDGILKEYVQRDRLDRRDAALASQLVYGVMQNRLLLDFYLSQVVSGPMSRLQPVMLDILRLGAYQILLLDKIPDSAAVNEAVEQTKHYVNKKAAGMTNGCLRALSRQKQSLRQPEDLATRYSHPQTLVELLQQSVGEEQIEAFLRAVSGEEARSWPGDLCLSGPEVYEILTADPEKRHYKPKEGEELSALRARMLIDTAEVERVRSALIQKFADTYPEADQKLFASAVEFAIRAHEGQFRDSGEPYIIHPMAVSGMIMEMGMDVQRNRLRALWSGSCQSGRRRDQTDQSQPEQRDQGTAAGGKRPKDVPGHG